MSTTKVKVISENVRHSVCHLGAGVMGRIWLGLLLVYIVLEQEVLGRRGVT